MRSSAEMNAPQETQPPQPSRQSRRIQGLPPGESYDINSVGPSIQDTNTSYLSSNSVATSHSHSVNSHVFPTVSTASMSQFSNPAPTLPSAMSMHMEQTYAPANHHQRYQHMDQQYIQPHYNMNNQTLYYDQPTQQMHYSHPDNHIPQFAKPLPKSRNVHPYHIYSKPPHDDITITSTGAPSSLSDSSTFTHNNDTPSNNPNLHEIQKELDAIKQQYKQKDDENKILMKQILESNNKMSTIFETLTSLQNQNKELKESHHLLKSTETPNIVNDALTHLLQSSKEATENRDASSIKFPKFHGKSKQEFRQWYDQILAILASPAWIAVYQNVPQQILKTDADITTSLSSKLYAALRTSMAGNAEMLMMSKLEVRGKGLAYLSILKQSYKETLHRADLLRKEKEYSLLFQSPSESIDDFAARCITIRNTLREHGVSCSDSGLCDRFLMGLGPIFTEIQQTPYDDLPVRWQTSDIQTLINLSSSYRDEKLAVRERNRLFREANKPAPAPKPNPTNKRQPADRNQRNDKGPTKDTPSWAGESNRQRQAKIEADIKDGTYDPMTYVWDVRPKNCIWHDSNTHHSRDCLKINSLLDKHPNQRFYHQHKSHRPQSNQPTQAPRQRSPSTNRDTTTPSARHTTYTLPSESDVPSLDSNPFSELCIDCPDEDIVNNLDNSINNSVTNYSITCKSVKIAPLLKPSHDTEHLLFIIDSGAFPHMVNTKKHFLNYNTWKNNMITHVTLADGKTGAKIHGYGDITFHHKGHKHTLKNVLYVPALSHSLFSVRKHQLGQGNYVHFEQESATIAFPTFTIVTKSTNEYYFALETNLENFIPTAKIASAKHAFPVKKLSVNAKIPTRSTEGSAGLDLFSSQSITIAPGKRHKIKTDICMQIPRGLYGRIASRSGLSMTHNIDIAAGVIDSDYRGEIFPCIINNGPIPFHINKHDKIAQLILTPYSSLDLFELASLDETKREKGGFGSTDKPTLTIEPKIIPPSQPSVQKPTFAWNQLQKMNQKVTIKLPWSNSFEKGYLYKHENGYIYTNMERNDITHILPNKVIKNLCTSNKLMLGHHHNITKMSNTSEPTIKPPPLRTIDKPLSNAPSKQMLNMNQLHKGFGFRNVNSFIKELKETATNFSVSTKDKEPILDIGQAATIDKSRRNTTPLPFPKQLGDVVHMDIVFGSGTAIQGVKYALFLVDRATRHKFVYPMKDLKCDIVPSLKQFVKDIGTYPKILRTDFDSKLIGNKIKDMFIDQQTQIESALPDEQNQNGLCERNWRTILQMSRSWLASSLLPSEFWWFAIKRATEVSNYVPLKLDGILTSPHELVYKKKVDLRNIFQMFAVAYPKYKHKSNTDIQSCKAILVGRSSSSHALEFYHPPTKQIITTCNCKIDESLTAGPAFNLPYDGGLFFNKYCEDIDKIRPPAFAPETLVFIKIDGQYTQCEIISIPKRDDTIYTIQYPDGSIHEIDEKFILNYNPSENPSDNDPPLHTIPKWIKNNSKCTLFLESMNQPSQGILTCNQNIWQFRPGHKHHKEPIDLPHLEENIFQLIATHQIFKGHIPFRKVYNAKQSLLLGKIVARHVSAKSLSSPDPPNLIKHSTLCTKDREIWNEAYKEEYTGLRDLPAWITISEKEYMDNRSMYGTLLPTMAISTIKHDENGQPKRAKYRIVALGNLDPHEWTKADCFAPVMSLMEVRFMAALSVKHQRILKSGDFKQAFVQSSLPSNETYVLKPPPGCPLTPNNTYWLLKRSIYGLKRAPRHWYNKAKQILTSIGLHSCPNAPCIFTGKILEDQPPIYLGLYVDDFIFFSTSTEVEQEFEKRLKEATNVDFMGTVTHFLGLKFQWRKQKDHVKVHISQEAFADTLVEQAGLTRFSSTTTKTPYRSGYPVDKIPPDPSLSIQQKQAIEAQYRSLVGSLLWLSQGTRPDLSTITNMLAKHQNNPTDKHISSAKHAIKYLKSTKGRGITFTSDTTTKLTSFLHFPIQTTKLTGVTDANWGPQDQSIPKPNTKLEELDLFKTRSISGHVITLHGPIHWSSKRQKITARSSAEAEIYATDECVKDILHIRNIIKDLSLEPLLLHEKTTIYNDNMACVLWSKNTTTKGLRYLQIRENAIRESANIIQIEHISGKINPADMFSKEDKDAEHFHRLRDTIVTPPFQRIHIPSQNMLSSKSPSNTKSKLIAASNSASSCETAAPNMGTQKYEEPKQITKQKAISTAKGNSEYTRDIKTLNTNADNACQTNPEPKTTSKMASLHQTGTATQENKHKIVSPKDTQKCNEHKQQLQHTKRVRFDLSRNVIHFIEKRNNQLTFTDILQLQSHEQQLHSRHRTKFKL